jgi:hypothetical protein
MRNKMITLCPTTYETAKKIPNFSAWVRNRLRDLEEYTPEILTPIVKVKYDCKICGLNYTRPFKKDWFCESCGLILGVVE